MEKIFTRIKNALAPFKVLQPVIIWEAALVVVNLLSEAAFTASAARERMQRFDLRASLSFESVSLSGMVSWGQKDSFDENKPELGNLLDL